jgi:hypothetical protein
LTTALGFATLWSFFVLLPPDVGVVFCRVEVHGGIDVPTRHRPPRTAGPDHVALERVVPGAADQLVRDAILFAVEVIRAGAAIARAVVALRVTDRVVAVIQVVVVHSTENEELAQVVAEDPSPSRWPNCVTEDWPWRRWHSDWAG